MRTNEQTQDLFSFVLIDLTREETHIRGVMHSIHRILLLEVFRFKDPAETRKI